MRNPAYVQALIDLANKLGFSDPKAATFAMLMKIKRDRESEELNCKFMPITTKAIPKVVLFSKN